MADTHIKINAVTPRVQYVGDGSTTSFPYAFAIFDDTDMVVYVGDEIIETGYTVTGAGQTEGGNVVFDTAPENGDIITLLRNVPIERVTDFQEGGTFRPKNLNDEFDRQTAFAQQVQEALSRCVKVDPTSESNPEEILPKVERLYESADNIDIVANDKANVDAVAGNATNIDAVAGNESNINTVAGISSDVSTVAGNATDISNVATNMSDVNDCATNMAAIQDAPTQAANAAASAELSAQYANDKINQTHITNCITEIPQDIKLELNSGTLTLKAGSKVYVPNGFEQDGTTPKFDAIIIESDVSLGDVSSWDTGERVLYYNNTDGTMSAVFSDLTSSGGSTSPSSTQWLWYDTTNNLIKRTKDSGSTWESNGSFILGIFTITNGVGVTSTNKVFNGFGYIGSTEFALPGVKGLIPNGRNDDGTLKSTPFEITNVLTYTFASNQNDKCFYGALVYPDNYLDYMLFKYSGTWYYDEKENYYKFNGVIDNKFFPFAKFDVTNGVISNWNPKTVFRSLDWNDKKTIAGFAMPSSTYDDLTLGASGTTYTAPANGWLFLSLHNTAASYSYLRNYTTGFVVGGFISANITEQRILPVKENDVIIVTYGSIDTQDKLFRFIYAEGEV